MPSLPSNGEIHLLNVPNTYLLTSRYRRRRFFLPICYADFMFHLLAMKIVVKILHFLTRSWYMNKVQCVHKFCFFVQKKHNRAKLFWKEHSFFHKPLWFSTNVFNFQHSILIHAYYEFWNRKWEYHFKGDFMMHNLD